MAFSSGEPAAGAGSATIPSAPRLTASEAGLLVAILRDHCGLSIPAENRSFLELRLGRRLRNLGLASFSPYIALLLGAEGATERQFLAESLVTHTTSFFRERAHFDWLNDEGLPALAQQGTGRISDLVVWSAACSTGQELWTAAILLDRACRGPLGRLRWTVVGTDLSRSALRRAQGATYSEEEIAGLPEDWRSDYLLRSSRPVGGRHVFRIIPELRRRAQFHQINLLDPGRMPGITADIIFLRNVLIYFDLPDQGRVIHQLCTRLRRGGYLLTGHSESLVQPPPGLVPVQPSIYRKD